MKTGISPEHRRSLDGGAGAQLPPIDPFVDHVAGPADASVVLIQYCDFECPYCGAGYFELKRFQQSMGSRLALVFRHFPLMELHPHAMAAARFAQAASTIGRFWQMHDILFERQRALKRNDLISYGRVIGMNDQLIEDALGDRFTAEVLRGLQSGLRVGVHSTPSLFINGYRYDGAVRLDALNRAVADLGEATT